MNGLLTQTGMNGSSQSQRRSVRACLASCCWWLTGLLAISIIGFLAAGGLTVVVGGVGQ